jgi:HD-like signal output (HDOD) protein
MRDLNDLPPMPQIIFKAYDNMDDPNSSTKQVADLIETDQAIAAKVLKMVNSAYYGLSGKVSSIQHASVVLGCKALRELITLAGTSSLLRNRLHGYDIDSAELWRHSMSVAFGSKIIARCKKPELENDAFSAGPIHDVGKLILDRPILNRKSLFNEYMESGDKTFISAEKQILGLDHAEIGYEICCRWNIPESLSKAIRCHHRPNQSSSTDLDDIVYMANTIANMAESMDMVGSIESDIEGLMYMVGDEVLNNLEMEEKDIGDFINEVVNSVENISREISPN